ncbi:MAG: M23 family metallopeptidase [Candidatus Dojkabacteria bacterium]|nr:MAG: M23 family metallopeptidase [Candidatus Dojkabacteria bacterium]
MMEENKPLQATKNAVEIGDSLVGDVIGLASNKVAPVIGPILVNIIWKNKWKILLANVVIFFFVIFALEAIAYQVLAGTRGLIEEIPQEHRECIDKASRKYSQEFELIASYGKVIADFDEKHTGNGVGFLEIPQSDWDNYGSDGNNNNEVTHEDLCDNYFTLSNILSAYDGDAEKKINQYSYPKKEEVYEQYQMYVGLMYIPYGNPIGLNRTDLVTVTSGFNVVRVIDGVKNVHKGVDIVPSSKWYQENPGKGSTDSINRAILTGKVSNFKDGYGALCSYITNDYYRVLYCHCDAFIAQDGSTVKYGDPICFMGNTGFSTGVHTHIGMYEKNSQGGWNLIDPTPFLFPTNYYDGNE